MIETQAAPSMEENIKIKKAVKRIGKKFNEDEFELTVKEAVYDSIEKRERLTMSRLLNKYLKKMYQLN